MAYPDDLPKATERAVRAVGLERESERPEAAVEQVERLLVATELDAWLGPEGMWRFLRELEGGGWCVFMEAPGPCAVAIAAERMGYVQVVGDKCRITQKGQIMRKQLWLIRYNIRDAARLEAPCTEPS